MVELFRPLAARVVRGIRPLIALYVACCLGAVGTGLFAQTLRPVTLPPPRTMLADKLDRRGSLSLTKTPIADALLVVGEQWQVNIAVGKDIEGTVSGTFTNAPLQEVLGSILIVNGYGYRPMGDSLVVMPLEQLGDANPLLESITLPLTAVKPEDVLESARSFNSAQGNVQAIAAARALLVVDYPDRVQLVRKFVQDVDEAAAAAELAGGNGASKLEVAYYSPSFVAASALAEPLQAILSEEGKTAEIEGENQLIIVDHPDYIERVRHVLASLDRPRMQVRVTALIYDVGLDDVRKLGINFHPRVNSQAAGSDGNPLSMWEIASTVMPPAQAATQGAMTFLKLTERYNITTIVHMLDTMGDSRLLADPSVVVTDLEDAEIKIVSEIPVQQLTETEAGGNIGTTEFREAGIKLKVQPRIGSDGTIQMVVTPSFSRVAGFTTGDTVQPIFDNREATTTVRVANSQTLVIGGLRQRSESQDMRGIPWLRDIRFLHMGELFKGREQTVRESELVVFITPEIVTPVYAGRDREQVALGVARSQLEHIPIASTMRFPIHSCRGSGTPRGMGMEETKGAYMQVPPIPDNPSGDPAPDPRGIPPSYNGSVLAPPDGMPGPPPEPGDSAMRHPPSQPYGVAARSSPYHAAAQTGSYDRDYEAYCRARMGSPRPDYALLPRHDSTPTTGVPRCSGGDGPEIPPRSGAGRDAWHRVAGTVRRLPPTTRDQDPFDEDGLPGVNRAPIYSARRSAHQR